MPTPDEAVAIVHQHFDGTKEVGMPYEWQNRINDARADSEYATRPMIKGEAKDALANDRSVFEITAVRLADTKHGSTYFVDVKLRGGYEGTLAFAGKTASGKRETNLAGMIEHFDRNGAEPIPARLRSYNTSFGNKGYDLEPA